MLVLVVVQELLRVAERCGYSTEEFKELFAMSDKNADGVLTLPEFIEMMKASFL